MRSAAATEGGEPTIWTYEYARRTPTTSASTGIGTDAPTAAASPSSSSVAAEYTPFGYTGGLIDRTIGSTLNGARYYDPAEGRWTQMDTLDAPLDPFDVNRYAYAASKPIDDVDPTGRATRADFIGSIADGLLAAVIAAPFAAAAGAAAGSLALAAGVVVGARLVSGCAGGVFGDGVSSEIRGQSASRRSLGWSCATGAVSGGFI